MKNLVSRLYVQFLHILRDSLKYLVTDSLYDYFSNQHARLLSLDLLNSTVSLFHISKKSFKSKSRLTMRFPTHRQLILRSSAAGNLETTCWRLERLSHTFHGNRRLISRRSQLELSQFLYTTITLNPYELIKVSFKST